MDETITAVGGDDVLGEVLRGGAGVCGEGVHARLPRVSGVGFDYCRDHEGDAASTGTRQM
ncbi:hypothetical protein GCM10009736_32200 [Actinomadura bangladeshensis]